MAVTLKQPYLVFSMVNSIILFDFALFEWAGGWGDFYSIFGPNRLCCLGLGQIQFLNVCLYRTTRMTIVN